MPVEITVNDSCTACGRCRKICPKGPRVWDKRLRQDDTWIYYAKDPTSCLFCKNCMGACPADAIKVINVAKHP